MMRRDGSDGVPLTGAAAVIAVACCADLPALGAVLGGLTLAAVLGGTGGVLLAAVAIAAVALASRSRRRHQGAATTRRPIR